jgi:hypothetical protein
MLRSESITELSLKELVSIFRLLGSWEDGKERPEAVLMGGWAVYSYNKYHGSTDVDILAPNRVRDSLIRELKRGRGYEYRPLEDGEKPQLYRDFESGRVIVDFINPSEKYPFPGKSDALSHSFIYERLRKAALGGLTVPVPERTALLVTKLKAAWDRRIKLDTYSGIPDRAFQEGKIVKDLSDILALIDSGKGGMELDLQFLDSMLEQHSFLRSVLEECGRSGPAAELYGKSARESKDMVRRLMGLLSSEKR